MMAVSQFFHIRLADIRSNDDDACTSKSNIYSGHPPIFPSLLQDVTP